jgi:hypothetical protein
MSQKADTPCPIHGKPGLVIYPCCVGAKGGQATSPAKGAASRVNAEKARATKAARTPFDTPAKARRRLLAETKAFFAQIPRQAKQDKRPMAGDAPAPDRPP